jgi:hypothetical protein
MQRESGLRKTVSTAINIFHPFPTHPKYLKNLDWFGFCCFYVLLRYAGSRLLAWVHLWASAPHAVSTVLHEQGYAHEHKLQLAPSLRNAVSAADNHALYLGPRAKMMSWADYLEFT